MMIKRIATLTLMAMFAFANHTLAYDGSYGSTTVDSSGYTMSSVSSSDLEPGYVKTSRAFPTGRESSSAVLLEKHFPEKGRVGKDFTYMIEVTNLTSGQLEGVKVTEDMPDNFSITASEPEVTNKLSGKATWELGTLEANATKIIKVTGQAYDKKSSPCCAEVEYELPALCHKTILEEPAVALQLNAPAEILACDLIELEYVVKNTGDSFLNTLDISSELPKGVVTSSGTETVNLSVNSLAAGESQTVKVLVQAEEPGQYRFSGAVKGEDVSAKSKVQYTKVVKPKVSVDIKTKRNKQYIGRNIDYTIEVKNTSDVDADATMVVAEIPANTMFVSASDEGRLVEDIVGWEVGTLKSYESKKLDLVLKSVSKGTARAKVGVQAACCDSKTDTVETELVGIPALLLEVIDLVDPIEVGEEETYVIKVTNQGTADATNVSISAKFDGMEYVSDSGQTQGNVTGTTIKFDAVKALGPKESVSWNVKVKGKREGDLRFRVSLTSSELTDSVEEEESTFVY